MTAGPISCRVLGHRYRFTTDGTSMHWSCERGCGAGGSKQYDTAEEAVRYATAFDREDRASIGTRPTLSLLPLWLARRLRRP